MKCIAFRYSRTRHYGFDIGPENPTGLSFDGMILRKHHTAIMVVAQYAHFDYLAGSTVAWLGQSRI